jgi:hypothetical protein
MANIKDFIKKIGNETVSLEEQQRALAAVEQTIVEAKAKREESIGKNVDLVISALKKIESDLEAKLIELNNTPAKQGVAGPKGEKGRDGRDGVDGYKGQDGKDGVDGQDGKDGEDGISVTDAKVDFDGSLVITLSDGREIDAGVVMPLDVAKQIHSVSTNGGGTSQSVLDSIDALQTQINALIPSQTGNSGKYLTTNGTTTSWGTVTSGGSGTVTSVGGTGIVSGISLSGTVTTSGNLTLGGTLDLSSPPAIGGTAPAAGTFTLISATRINPRLTNTTSTATLTPASDSNDQVSVTALAVGMTVAIPSGTPVGGQKLTIRIKDNGTAQTLTWTTSAGGYRVIGCTLPTTTVASKVIYVGCIYNATESFWDVVSVAQQI